jgi:uncharacterized repeat protein (TIGR03803 family)
MRQHNPSLGKFHFNNFSSVSRIAMPFAMVLALSLLPMQSLRAQTYTVIHNFTGGRDGAYPSAGVTVDAAGNLYGTTEAGGRDFGVVYQLKLRDGNYTVNPLYEFMGGDDGAAPYARVVFGPDGLLYGTTYAGGQSNGVVFKLQPRPTVCVIALCSWMETVLYAFPANGSGGIRPYFGDVIFDGTGDMYGTAGEGGDDGDGVVWELTPPGTWSMETLLNSFTGGNGRYPYGGPILDSSGNLYGTTLEGGTSNDGVVYQLVPSSGGWTENVLYNFTGGNDGSLPVGGLVFDASGNLYGASTYRGASGGGVIFQLSPPGTWTTFTPIYSFSGSGLCETAYSGGAGPGAQLTMDSAGKLYGTTCADGTNGYGNVFKLSPSSGGWAYTDLYDFTGGSDGGHPVSNANPVSNAICDSAGNLYGTTSVGGTDGDGVVWKISGVGCLLTNGAPFHP